MHPSEEVPRQAYDLVEIGLQRPVPAVEQLQFDEVPMPGVGADRPQSLAIDPGMRRGSLDDDDRHDVRRLDVQHPLPQERG